MANLYDLIQLGTQAASGNIGGAVATAGMMSAKDQAIQQEAAKQSPPVAKDLQDQLKFNLSKGYSDTQILDNLSRSPNTEMNDQIRAARSQYGDTATMKLFLSYIQEKTGEKFGQPTVGNWVENAVKTTPVGAVYDIGKELINATLTGSAGAAISGGQVMAGQMQGKSYEEAHRDASEPMYIPGVGNINPRSKSPIQLAGQAVNLGVMTLNPFGQLAKGAQNLISDHIKNKAWKTLLDRGVTYLSSGATGASLAGAQGAIENRDLEEIKNMAILGGGLGLAIPMAQDFWKNRHKVTSWFYSGVKKLTGDDKKVPVKLVKEYIENQNKTLELVDKTHEAIQKAHENHEIKYHVAMEENFLGEASAKRLPNAGKKGIIQEFKNILEQEHVNVKIVTDPVTGKTSLYYNDSVFAADGNAQARLNRAWDFLNSRPATDTVLQYDRNKQIIGGIINWANVQNIGKATTLDDKILVELWGKMRDNITTVLPGMDKIWGDWELWRRTLKTIGTGIGSLANGDTYLKNMVGRDNRAVITALEKIERESGMSIVQDIRAANIANMWNKGTGLFGQTFSILAGASLGNIIGQGVGGALIGSVVAGSVSPVINRYALVQALKTSQLADKVVKGATAASPVVQKLFQNVMNSLFPPDPRNSGWDEFYNGIQKRYPQIDQETAYQFYQNILKQVQDVANQQPAEQPTEQPATKPTRKSGKSWF